jgi:diguanylate cyclase
MLPFDPVDTATQMLRVAVQLMSQHNVAANPMNYSVWYTYVGKTNTPLNQAIDKHLESGRPFGEELCRELFFKFIADEQANAVERIQSKLHGLFVDMTDTLGKAGSEAGDFSDSLADYSAKLQSHTTVDGLGEIVSGMLQRTVTMRENSSELESRLDDANLELKTLREEMEKAKSESVIDPLTGVANRRAFDEALTISLQQHGENGTLLSLLMIDIDHFKLFNDKHGHLVGDQVLRMVAQTLEKQIRGGDSVTRFGGEEFVVILPKTDRDGALALGENIRNSLTAQVVKRRSTGKMIGRVTVSMGATSLIAKDDNESIIERADMALYRSKGEGRNRVSFG